MDETARKDHAPEPIKHFTLKLNDRNEYQSLMKPPRTHKMRSGRVVLKPGESVGVHNTDDMEEVLVILEGRGEARVGGHGHVHSHEIHSSGGHSHDGGGHVHSDTHDPDGKEKGGHHGYDTVLIEGGMVSYIPPHTVHDIVNTGEVPLKYVFVVGSAEKYMRRTTFLLS